MKKGLIWIAVLLLIVQCQGSVIKTDIIDAGRPVLKTDKIFILPATIINDVSLNNKELAQMYENIVFSLLRKEGYQVVGVEEMLDLTKSKKSDAEELRKFDLKDINRETIEKLKEFKAQLIVKPGIIAYPKEGISAVQNIFINIKFYHIEDSNLSMINLSYEGEESIYSNKIISVFKSLLEKWMDRNDEILKKSLKK